MAQMTPDMVKAFRVLGITPEAGPDQIKAAWKAMVRSYHPDRVAGDPKAANERLAEINTAFEVTSCWTADDARMFDARRTKAAQRQAEALRRQAAKRAAAEQAAAKKRADAARQKMADRQAAEAAARQRAQALDSEEAAKRAHRAARARRRDPIVVAAEMGFLAALRVMARRAPRNDLGFA